MRFKVTDTRDEGEQRQELKAMVKEVKKRSKGEDRCRNEGEDGAREPR